MTSEALRLSAKEEGDSYLWLADTYDTLPDYDPENPGAEGTFAPVASDWRSPFVGSSVKKSRLSSEPHPNRRSRCARPSLLY
jgi:hypothetical protein